MEEQKVVRMLRYGHLKGSRMLQVHCCLPTTLQTHINLVKDSCVRENIKLQVKGIFRLQRNFDLGRNYLSVTQYSKERKTITGQRTEK